MMRDDYDRGRSPVRDDYRDHDRHRSNSRDREYDSRHRYRSPRRKRKGYYDDRYDYDSRDKRRRDYRDDDYSTRKSYHDSEPSRYDRSIKSFSSFIKTIDVLRYSESEVLKRYDDYKYEYNKNNYSTFFNDHKDEFWFFKKYQPSMLQEKKKNKSATSSKLADKFWQTIMEVIDTVNYSVENNQENLSPEVLNNSNGNKTTVENGQNNQSSPNSNNNESKPDNMDTKNEKNDSKNSDKNEKNNDYNEPNVLEPVQEPYTIEIYNIPSNCSTSALIQKCESIGEINKFIITDPIATHNFVRMAWVRYKTAESFNDALTTLNQEQVSEWKIQAREHKSRNNIKYDNITPPIDDGRISKDIETIKKIIDILDKNYNVNINPLSKNKSDKAEESIVEKINSLSQSQYLDVSISYLRKVHFFCYYCSEEFEDENYLLEKCAKHIRGNDKIHHNVDSSKWFHNLDKKLQMYIDFVKNEDALTAESCINKKIEELLNHKTQKDSDERYGCLLCQKMFKGELFVHKHIQNKHEDSIEKAKEKAILIQYQKNYESDPHHISPSDVVGAPESELIKIYNSYYKSQKEKKEKEEQEREERRKEYYNTRKNSNSNSNSYQRRDNYRPERKFDNYPDNRDRKLVDYSDIAIDWDKPKEEPLEIDYTKSLHEFIPKS